MNVEDWEALQPIITSFVMGVIITIVCWAIDRELSKDKKSINNQKN